MWRCAEYLSVWLLFELFSAQGLEAVSNGLSPSHRASGRTTYGMVPAEGIEPPTH